MNKELTIPVANKTYPFESYETGKLRQGNGNPYSIDYDSLADYEINEHDGVVEIRIPWLMLNVTDPGRREIWEALNATDSWAYKTIDGIGIEVQLVKNGAQVDSLPVNGEAQRYSWETWDMPQYKARLKESYYILQKRFLEIE